MKNWKKMLAAGLICATAAAFCQPAEAAYQLNPEVKNATMALKAASEIGVLKNENKDLANLVDKDAIVVMTFGTTYKDTRAKTIDATVKAIEAAHPGVKVVTAYTSHIIIDRVAKNEGIKFPTPEEALDSLKAEGYSRVALCAGIMEMIARTFVGIWAVPRFGYDAACLAGPFAWLLADAFLIPAYFACLRAREQQAVEAKKLAARE